MKIFKKSQPDFQHYVNKIENQAKKWFSYKKKRNAPIIKSTVTGLRPFLATKSPLKMMKNVFYFTSKALFILNMFEFSF